MRRNERRGVFIQGMRGFAGPRDDFLVLYVSSSKRQFEVHGKRMLESNSVFALLFFFRQIIKEVILQHRDSLFCLRASLNELKKQNSRKSTS